MCADQAHEFREILQTIGDGTVDPTPVITGTAGLEGVASAFGAFGDPVRHAKTLIARQARSPPPDPGTPRATARG